jgi:subtilisin-like proprotein convertase family protein
LKLILKYLSSKSWKINEWLEKDKGTNIKELKSNTQPTLKSENDAADKNKPEKS